MKRSTRSTAGLPMRAAAVLVRGLFALLAGAFALVPGYSQSESRAGDSPEASLSSNRDQAIFFRRTLVQDISTAGFYELVSWLRTLGLSTRGDRSALADRLYEFYELGADEVAGYLGDDSGASDAPGSTRRAEREPALIVDSASRTRYFTLEEIDERYIRLSGGVVLTLRDEEQNAVHRVEADEITFNQDRDTLAASGSVVYVLERDDTVEQFTGEALTVELGDWSGAFVDGVTERERTIEGEQIDFSFTGRYITRSRDDVIVLDDGRITSSEAVPPNYEIRASKIWVLAPGEWGLQNAALYVGRVPVFYLPFFFKPGNEFFFNPSLGSRDRSGAYIQTTTYLRGTPDEETSPFSLLQIAEEQGPQSERRIEGLFLVPDEGRPTGESAENDPDDESAVRLLADVYTNLGAYLALDADLVELGPLRQVQFYAGLAASRHIYLVTSPARAYTPYFISDGQAVQSWNTSQIGGLTLPFRFGIDAQAQTRGERFSASARLNYYSDPRFLSDFGDRSERIDWLGLLEQGTSTSASSPISSLLWQVDGSWRADTSNLPGVTQLSIQRALFALDWRSRAVPETLLAADALAADQSPERSFFYPQTVRFPELSAGIGGTLFEYPPTASRSAPEDEDEREELIPPWSENEDAEEDREEADDALALFVPAALPAVASPDLPEMLRARLGYSLSPTTIVNSEFRSDSWQQPSDVTFDTAYSGASVRMSGSLGYSGAISARALELDGSLSTSTQYRTVFSRDPLVPDTQWTALEQQAWSFTGFNATNNATLRLFPVRDVSVLADSSLSYSSQIVVYRVVYDSLVADTPVWNWEAVRWDEEFVRQHQIQATAQFNLAERQTLQLAAALPPRPEQYTANLTARLAPLVLTMSGGVRRPENEWTYDPVAATATLQPHTDLRLVNALSYNVEEEQLSFNRTTLAAGPASAEFELRTTQGFVFAGPGIGWQVEGEPTLRPASARFSLSLDADLEPLWKNRIVADLGADLSWNSSLIRFTESSFRFVFSGSLLVHRFLRLSLQTTSTNSQGYVYIPGLAQIVGREPRNIVLDLARSFNFFNEADRIDSGFNLQSIEFDATHDLGDWDLAVGYTGRPEIVTSENGSRAYEWQGVLDVTLEWRPIRELRSSVRVDADGEVSFEGDS